MKKNDPDIHSDRITFFISNKQKVDLRIMCILVKKTMSQFIRIAIQEKIKQMKENK